MELSGVKVFLQGFDTRSIERFEVFFSEQCNNDYLITQQQISADIIILDFDTLKNMEEINQQRQAHVNRPIILLSSLFYHHKDPLVFSLKKPLNHDDFYGLLQQVSLVTHKNISPAIELREALLNHIQSNINNASVKVDKLSQLNTSMTSFTQSDKTRLSTLVGRLSDIDIEQPQAIMRVLFDQKKLLLGTIKRGISRATHNKKMIELANFGHKFVIDPKRESIFTFTSESVLRPLCLMSTNDISTIKNIKKGRNDLRFSELTQDKNVEVKEWGWDEFLWKIGLWTARGKLPRDIDLNLPVTLSNWPNFSKLQTFPYALSIAAMMIKQPIKLTDIAKKLNIEQRFVFSFYSAANAIGIASNSTRQSDTLFDRGEVKTPEQALSSKQLEINQSHSVMKKMFGFLTGNNTAQSSQTNKKQGNQ